MEIAKNEKYKWQFGNKFNENEIYQEGDLVQLVFFAMTHAIFISVEVKKRR